MKGQNQFLKELLLYQTLISPGQTAPRASKRHVFTVVGNQQSNRESFYLADTKQEVIMVYEYGAEGDGLGLASARSQEL